MKVLNRILAIVAFLLAILMHIVALLFTPVFYIITGRSLLYISVDFSGDPDEFFTRDYVLMIKSLFA